MCVRHFDSNVRSNMDKVIDAINADWQLFRMCVVRCPSSGVALLCMRVLHSQRAQQRGMTEATDAGM